MRLCRLRNGNFIVLNKSAKKKKKEPRQFDTQGDAIASSPIPRDTRPTQPPLAQRTQKILPFLAGSIALLTLVVYSSDLRNNFVASWDDGTYILNNPFIRSFNINFFKWAFFDFYASNWHPLTWLSHAVDYALWGLNPRGHHLTNNILHAVNTFLVVILLSRLLEAWQKTAAKKGASTFLDDRAVLITAGITGFLFGLHPLHAESVAWVAERKDVLCALFFLLSVGEYTKYASVMDDESVQKKLPSRFLNRHYAGSFGFFVLASLSKPMAISLPLVLLLLDWHPFGRNGSFKSFRTAFIEKLPFIAVSLILAILTLLAQKSGQSMGMMVFVPLSTRALVAIQALFVYLWKIIVPLNLLPFYPYPRDVSLFSLEYLSVCVLAAGVTIACLLISKSRKLFLSVWGYYVITLTPVLGLVQVGGQSMADRYSYLPGLGPFLVIGIAGAWISKKVRAVQVRGAHSAAALMVAAALILSIPVIYLTVDQIGIWKNSIALWSHVIEKRPFEVPRAYYNRGYSLREQGEPYRAIEDFDRAIALNPVFYEAFNLRGCAFMDIGQLNKAIDDFNRAIALNAGFSDAYLNRGIAFSKIGLYENAVESVSKSLEINPKREDGYVERGIDYLLSGRYDEARGDLNQAIVLNPDDGLAYYNRAYLHLATGNRELAASDYQRSCERGYGEGCKKLNDLVGR
jgi:tetratricopeptide (TPR) repeat protein